MESYEAHRKLLGVFILLCCDDDDDDENNNNNNVFMYGLLQSAF
jgi:hypothetical protein